MEELMKRMQQPSQICRMQNFLPMEGYLYCQEKCEFTAGFTLKLVLVKNELWPDSS